MLEHVGTCWKRFVMFGTFWNVFVCCNLFEYCSNSLKTLTSVYTCSNAFKQIPIFKPFQNNQNNQHVPTLSTYCPAFYKILLWHQKQAYLAGVAKKRRCQGQKLEAYAWAVDIRNIHRKTIGQNPKAKQKWRQTLQHIIKTIKT